MQLHKSDECLILYYSSNNVEYPHLRIPRMPLLQIVSWMFSTVDEAVAAGVDARIVEIGASHEGRMMYLIEVIRRFLSN